MTGIYGSQIGQLPPDNTYDLPPPMNLNHLNAFLGTQPMKISGCVLPGLDFRGNQTKVCQDAYTFVLHNNCLLCIICDGHGTEGQAIASFSTDYCLKYFKKHFSKFKTDPKAMTAHLFQKCDKRLMATIDCELSGTTIVLLFIDNGIVYTASLGDSRAVLGSAAPVADVSKPRSDVTAKYFRKITCDRSFKACSLTTDQKPDLNEEMLRIRLSGGVVERYTDAFGRTVGPYRVWSKEGSGPGLAMSRSLGDKMGKSCGVISVPIFQDRVLVSGKDQYIVIATDGLWDVMDGIDAINFVERWKGRCERTGTCEYPATTSNCSISRLLCEEARYRWLGVAENERVAIDDITCIVVDFVGEQGKDTIVGEPGDQRLAKLESFNNSSRADED